MRLPRALFDRLVEARDSGDRVLRSDVQALLHLVAVRFDLCDRQLPGVCPEAEDARLRLVFQPIHKDGASEDVGFHAFYAIRNTEIADAVAALRALARSAPEQDGALRVSPALSAGNPEAYAEKLRAFVTRMLAKSWTIEPTSLPGRYTSQYDLSVTGGSSPTSHATRALGYIGRTPLISQRVVKETAQTLTEIAARYPEVQSN